MCSGEAVDACSATRRIQTQPTGDSGDKEDNGDLVHCCCESLWTEGRSSLVFLQRLICRLAVLVNQSAASAIYVVKL